LALLSVIGPELQAQQTGYFTPQSFDKKAKQAIAAERLLPKVQQLESKQSRHKTPAGWTLDLDAAFKDELATISEVAAELGMGEVKQAAQAANLIIKKVEPSALKPAQGSIAPELANEAYRLDFDDTIRIEASDRKGVFYALQTLRQILPAAGGEYVAGSIIDWPSVSLRGFMHDTGRNFQPLDDLKKQIQILARYKINTFHWHLTDNPGWRLESKKHPQVNNEQSFSRHHGKFYTQEQFKELFAFAAKHHVLIIPELDVPGHSAALRRGFGIEKMNEPHIRQVMIDLVDEMCQLLPKEQMPYVHLGTDEVKANERVPKEWLEACVDVVNKHGRRVIGWNPGIKLGNDTGIQQTWTGHARIWKERSWIDSQNSMYLNHVDPFENLAAATFQKTGNYQSTDKLMGGIICIWHDDHARNSQDILQMNAVYPGCLLWADNMWSGREKYIFEHISNLPTRDNALFAQAEQLESRLLAQRDAFFAKEPFPYLKQTELEWRFIGPFDHQGDVNRSFAPETQGIKPFYEEGGQLVSWWPKIYPGATHYPQHFFCFPSLYKGKAGTVYAFTRIHSPKAQTVEAWIGANAWSRSAGRSRGGSTPDNGQWNSHGAKFWVNRQELAGPTWEKPKQSGKQLDEVPLTDEDYYYRPAYKIQLKEGWNDVMVKIPKANQWKWVFTFIPVQSTGEGFNVREVEGLKYNADFSGEQKQQYDEALAKIAAQKPSVAAAGDDTGYSGFNDAKNGAVSEVATARGIWKADNAEQASIIDYPREKGRKVLRIMGGGKRSVVLQLNDVENLKEFSLDVERWSSTGKFSWEVELLVDGEWKKLKVAQNIPTRKFSRINIPLGDQQSNALRISVDSDNDKGLMIKQIKLQNSN